MSATASSVEERASRSRGSRKGFARFDCTSSNAASRADSESACVSSQTRPTRSSASVTRLPLSRTPASPSPRRSVTKTSRRLPRPTETTRPGTTSLSSQRR